jgi:uncharacterized protein YjbI with pentapeptide repeats
MGRFEGQRIAFGGKLAKLRKNEVVEVLEAEGASVADKLDKETTLFVYAVEGSSDHRKAEKQRDRGAALDVIGEDEFRRRLLPSADDAFSMLIGNVKGRTRLANLLELNRPPYMRSTDEYSTVTFTQRSFAGAKLSSVSLCGLHFIECDLQGADLTSAKWLAGARTSDFRKVKGKECELVDAEACDFRDAQLPQASMRDMRDCRFEGANLAKANGAGELTRCAFDGATLDGFSASYAELRGCSFANASLQNAKLEQCELEACNFAGADLRGATLEGDSDPLVFTRCDLRGADLRGAILSHVRFDSCDLTGARFDDAKLAGLELVNTDGAKAEGLAQTAPPAKGAAIEALEAAAPTFKNITVTVQLVIKAKQVECVLYQFDHSANTSCRQAWLAGENVGALTIADAISTIAKLKPGAKVDATSLVVKSSKGKTPPSLKPKELERAVLAAWQEALA